MAAKVDMQLEVAGELVKGGLNNVINHGCQVAWADYMFSGGASHSWVLNVKSVSIQLVGAQKFAVVSGFLENLGTPP